jgi:hypothetical protein
MASRPELASRIADVKIFRGGIVADVIGIDAERHARCELQIIATENLVGAVAAIGDEQPLEVGGIEHALRLALIADAEDAFARGKVDDLDGVLIVAERGGEQPMAVEIDTQVVHAPRHARQRNALHQGQRRGWLSGGAAERQPRQCERDQ